MNSSYQNSSFLKSKKNFSYQNSEYIIEANDFTNKENRSHQLNKSSSHASILGIKQKSQMLDWKQKSICMGDSKIKSYLNPIDQNQPNYSIQDGSKFSNRNMIRSYKNNPQLKLLTESDLTENYDNQDEFFSDEQNKFEVQYSANHQCHKQELNNPQLKQKSSRIPNIIEKARDIYEKRMQANKCNARQYQNEEINQNDKIPFVFIPSQKLQVKYFGVNQQEKSKTYNTLKHVISLIPYDLSVLKSIKKLTLTHCFLKSLEGVEIFNNLEDINIRKNQLREIQELYRIQNKQNIRSINFSGNDIQHYHQARFHIVSKIFPNLIELNDKDYSVYKRNNKGEDIKKAIKKSAKIQYELRKTLRKQSKKTDRAFLKFNPSLFYQQQTQRTNRTFQPDIFNKKTQQDDYSYENDGNFSSKDGQISKRSNTESKSPISKRNRCGFNKKNQIDEQNQVYQIQHSNINSHSYSLGQNSNNKLNFHPLALKQVSLGNLENVPITKSVKYSQQKQKSPSKKRIYSGKQNNLNQNQQIPLQTIPISRNLLQIKTEGLDNAQLNGHLHQPTATFAMQKEKQQKYAQQNKQFMFKNRKNIGVKSKVKRQSDQVEEQQYSSEEQYQQNEMNLSRLSKMSQIPTKRMSNYHRKSNNSCISQRIDKSKYDNLGNQNMSQQSFMTGNDFYGQNGSYLMNNQNNSYLAYSQFSQYRPNQSMDEDCLLKDKKDLLEEEQLAIVTAIYMQNLLKKSFFGLIFQGKKRKNLPKKRTFF